MNVAMAKILLVILFIEAQRYNTSYNKLLQYNKSAILLEKNGKELSSELTKQIKTSYFFAT